MAVEVEFKYILAGAAKDVVAKLRSVPEISERQIQQGYLTPEARIRSMANVQSGVVEHVFTFKRRVDGDMVEIETLIEKSDFADLWPTCIEKLEKTRFSFSDGDITWDVDIFGGDVYAPYFMMAEAELSTGREAPGITQVLEEFFVHFAGVDKAFSSRALSDRAHAAGLMAKISQI